jgi:hypothetical protein
MSDEPRITQPEQLEQLDHSQLFQRVKPILRKGGLLDWPAQLERIKPMLVSVCWELGRQWEHDPRLSGRLVPFDEFLATKLCNQLRAQDRKENPHLYDPHGKYLPERTPLPLDEELPHPQDRSASLNTNESPTASSLERLAETAQAAAIAPASINALLQHVTGMQTGKTTSPYKLARAQGLSTTEARYQPASAAYIAITQYIDYTATGPPPR